MKNSHCLIEDSPGVAGLPFTVPDGQAHAPQPVDPVRQKYLSSLGVIARQSSVYFAGSAFTLTVGYIFRVFIARKLGAELLGLNALGMSIYGLCKLVGQMGLPQTAVRFVAAYTGIQETNRLTEFFWRGLAWTVAGTTSCGVMVFALRDWIAVRIFHAPAFAHSLPLFAMLIPIGAANSFLLQALCGFKRITRSTAITNFIAFPCMMLLTVASLALGLSLWGYVAAQLAAETLTLVLAALSLRRLLPQLKDWNNLAGGPLLPEIRWFAASVCTIGVLEFTLGQADRLIAGSYLQASQVGIYAVAGSATAIIAVILQSVNSIFGPTIASLHAQGDYTVLGQLFETLTKWILGLTIPLILLFVIWSQPLMGLFGNDFRAGSSLLVILCLGQAVNCATGSVGYLLLMSGQQKAMIRGQLIFGVSLLLADCILIPIGGVMAAAVISAMVTASINLYYLVAVRKTLGLFPYSRAYFKLVGPAAGAAGTIWLTRTLGVGHNAAALPSAIVSLALGYAAFFGSFVLFGLSGDDRALFDLGRARFAGMFAGHNQSSLRFS
jgi:O-antigen/teichoic acid export membrane protein